jgi:hypothetical protein
MRFIHQEGFDVKLGKTRELRRWLASNEDRLRSTCPGGVAYLGTYSVVETTERGTGDIRLGWGMEDLEAMDGFTVAMRRPGAFQQLLNELFQFADERPDRTSTTLLRAVTAI